MDSAYRTTDKALRLQQNGAFGFPVFLCVIFMYTAFAWHDIVGMAIGFASMVGSFVFGAIASVTMWTRTALREFQVRITKLEQQVAEPTAST
jgi:hypothetical protein